MKFKEHEKRQKLVSQAKRRYEKKFSSKEKKNYLTRMSKLKLNQGLEWDL